MLSAPLFYFRWPTEWRCEQPATYKQRDHPATNGCAFQQISVHSSTPHIELTPRHVCAHSPYTYRDILSVVLATRAIEQIGSRRQKATILGRDKTRPRVSSIHSLLLCFRRLLCIECAHALAVHPVIIIIIHIIIHHPSLRGNYDVINQWTVKRGASRVYAHIAYNRCDGRASNAPKST